MTCFTLLLCDSYAAETAGCRLILHPLLHVRRIQNLVPFDLDRTAKKVCKQGNLGGVLQKRRPREGLADASRKNDRAVIRQQRRVVLFPQRLYDVVRNSL